MDAYADGHGSNHSWVSTQMNMSRQGLSSWWKDGLSAMPSPYQLVMLAKATRTPYRDVLDAALADFAYLPESAAERAEPPARMNRKGQPQGRRMRQKQDDDGQAPDPDGPEFGA